MQSLTAFADDKTTDNMFGVWGSLTLQGDFKSFISSGDKFKWLIMDQSRTRENGPNNDSRFTENILFSQAGYQLNDNASVWLGYAHDWLHPPPNKPAFQENRAYQDFLWNRSLGDFKLTSRTRMEERINQTTGDTGYRPRQLLQISHPLPILNDLSAYAGDEVFFYLNQNNFGKRGFTENRAFGGLSYQFTTDLGVDLGYMGQYISNAEGNNLFTHNLQANIRYHF
ncbi:MAG: DUF2490 domain-containing protein [Gammaproteobacteria bacterium]